MLEAASMQIWRDDLLVHKDLATFNSAIPKEENKKIESYDRQGRMHFILQPILSEQEVSTVT